MLFSFTDKDGSTWIRNLDGTYRCLDADIPSMRYEEIEREFGPIKES